MYFKKKFQDSGTESVSPYSHICSLTKFQKFLTIENCIVNPGDNYAVLHWFCNDYFFYIVVQCLLIVIWNFNSYLMLFIDGSISQSNCCACP